ncbi:MAG TPA: hypothetical protein VEF76_11330 [Patescibacteria group bacterium]|nr:hypothetical protein [Patescibacteria group bacterium]
MMADESFEKENDYTLTQNVKYTSSGHHTRSIARQFNFKAAQVTTIAREWLISGGAALTAVMDIRNFSEIGSPREIIDMHAKLKELGGNPPDLDDVLPQSAIKPRSGLTAAKP